MSDKKIPKIRFPEFTGDWEQRKLSSMITDIADGPFGSNLKTDHYTKEKEARIIQLSNLSDYGWQEENIRYTTFEHAKEIKRCIVNEGELVMGKMMPAGMTIMRPNTEKMYVLSSDCVRIKLDNNIATDKFFLYTTKSDTFLNQVNNDSQGSTRVRTSISKIREMEIAIPSVAEQEKIGEYFTNLDNLITLHQRKCEKIKEYKKGCLQKMFPKEGEAVPEVRFPEFTDAWEQRNLGDLIEDKTILEQSDGNHGELYPRSEEFTEEGIPYIAASSIAADGESIDFNLTKYLPIELAKQFRKGVAKNGDVLLAHNATVGPSVKLSMEYEFAVLSTSLTLYRLDKERMNADFFLQAIRSNYFQNQLQVFMKQTTRSQVPILTQRNLDICFPKNINEQIQVGRFLTNLDNLITLHQRECEKYKELKKGLLQQMFV